MANIKETYLKLKEKYKLPEFSELDSDFHISFIENDNFLLSQIIDRIIEKVDQFSGILEHILQPDTSSLKDLQETGFFEDYEKKEIYSIFKELVIINRSSIMLALEHDLKNEVEFISNSFEQWKSIKKKLSKHLIKLKELWLTENVNTEKVGYLG